MASVINDQIESNSTKNIVLIGYSGGGALSILIAPKIKHLAGVITIAANLDTLAWTTLHGYEPLTDSLNPVDSEPLVVPHLAFIGDRDLNVPYSSIARFVETHPQTMIERVNNYDHICCWEKNWPALLDAALAKMQITR
jgi:pimeloyl-ACP methyl ester carboxylesterase